jgi:BlaI family transcriptional regulator, penicillinase repressor
METQIKELTRAEEQVMQILWRLNKAFVKDIVEQFPEPKPAYNTVSTIIRILEKKGFVSYRNFGNTYEYFPVVTRGEYSKSFLSSVVTRYFGDSYQNLVSFFASDRQVSIRELEEIRKLVVSEIEKKKSHE